MAPARDDAERVQDWSREVRDQSWAATHAVRVRDVSANCDDDAEEAQVRKIIEQALTLFSHDTVWRPKILRLLDCNVAE